MSRCLRVADADACLAFYRDVLGFQIRTGEALRGPARIDFSTVDGGGDAAIVFFEVDDVKSMREEIAGRGGSVSSLERVNWIKYEVFEIRDPAGNTLWFAQTFAEDIPPGPPGQLRQALPELPFDDVEKAVEYYCRCLGFQINYQQAGLGVMYRDAITILLTQRNPDQKGIGSFEVYIEDADKLHAELTERGADVRGEPVSYPWGLRAFEIRDLENNRIIFAQTFE